MATFTASSTLITTQTLATDETGTILASGGIVVGNALAINVAGTNTAIINLGSIVSARSVGISASTTVTALNITNTGTISGDQDAIRTAQGAAFNGLRINNSGLIIGTGITADGISCASGGNYITNSGTITTLGQSAIQILQSPNGAVPNIIENTGLISASADGDDATILLSFDQDTIRNSGKIIGWVEMGGGDDVFDGRGGVVTGYVWGGAGSDTYRISDAAIVLQEDAGLAGGIDLVESTVSYALVSNFEYLILLADAVAGIGNGLGNALVGNSFDNRLTGLAGNDTMGGVAGNDLLRGGDGNDGLYGGLGDDILRGGNGNDILRGGAGADNLIGGQGADQFDFDLTSESRRDEMDTISLFARGQDDINLTTIDAKTGVASNQNFSFIGAAAFTAAGQVRIVDLGANVRVEVNTTGATGAEMVMMVVGVGTLTGSDFIL